MLISAPLQSVRNDVFHLKLYQRVQAIENEFSQYAKRYLALSEDKRRYFLAYEIPEMKTVFERWSGNTETDPEDLFPAYSRLRQILDMSDLNQKEIPLVDCKSRVYLNELEFLCFADVSELLSIQQVFDLLGIDLTVLPDS